MTSCKNITPVLYHCIQASLQMDVDQRTRERKVEHVLLEVIFNYDKNSITHALFLMTSSYLTKYKEKEGIQNIYRITK